MVKLKMIQAANTMSRVSINLYDGSIGNEFVGARTIGPNTPNINKLLASFMDAGSVAKASLEMCDGNMAYRLLNFNCKSPTSSSDVGFLEESGMMEESPRFVSPVKPPS